MASILIVDDEANIRWIFGKILADAGYQVRSAESGAAARQTVREQEPDLVFLDYQLPDTNGLDLMRALKADGCAAQFIVITAFESVKTAVAAVKEGAFDYLSKPIDNEEILLSARRALEVSNLRLQVANYRETISRLRGPAQLIGRSPALQAVVHAAERAADQRHQRPAHRRERHGQGPRGAPDPRPERTARGPLRRRRLRGAAGDARGERDLRPREGRVHRGRVAQPRQVRARPRRHAVPRRDRQRPRLAAGQAAARDRDQDLRPPRRPAAGARRRPGHRRDEPRPAPHGRRGFLPRRPVLPARRLPHRDPAAARAGGGHPGAGRGLRREDRAAAAPRGRPAAC